MKKYTCPKCGYQNEIEEDALQAMGHSIVCPGCQSVLKIDGDYAYIPLVDDDKPQATQPEKGITPTPPPFTIEEPPVTTPSIAEITGADHDPIYDDVIDYVRTCNAISVPMIAQYFNISIERAAHIMQELEKNGVVGPYNGGGPREILIDHSNTLPTGLKRNFEDDQVRKAIIEKIKAENGGELPKVRTFGCSCTTLIIILFAILILASILAK